MILSDKFISATNEICSFEKFVNAPYLRKTFELDFVPSTAEITICGLGFYELYINGVNITKGYLAPYISNTDDICYYDNYDIAKYLVEGKNAIGIILGNGFRNPFGGFVWKFEQGEHIGPVTVALSFNAKCDDKYISFEADESFKVHNSPIVFDEYRMGCHYDARLEISNWNMPEFDDNDWANAIMTEPPRGEKMLSYAEPITKRMELKPVKIEHFDRLPFAYTSTAPDAEPIESTMRDNVYVFDFGANSAGVTKLCINGEPGQKITIRHGEILQNGKFTINNIIFNRDKIVDIYHEYFQKDIYICKGGYEEFEPKFKYDGFRYAFVEGLKEEQVTNDTLTYIVMNTELNERATFKCSDETINRLFDMTRESDLSNFFYFPNDCPHREKNGWTGDIAVSAEHMLINLSVEKSLTQWLESVRKAQREDGALPGIVPTCGWGFFEVGFGPPWDGVCTYLPYYIYKYTGDTKPISDNSDMIIKYLKYLERRKNNDNLVDLGIGDWVDPFAGENGTPTSPRDVTGSICAYDIAIKARFIFEQIGMTEEATYCDCFAKKLRCEIKNKLVDENCLVSGNCQTSQAFAIEAGIFDDDELETARQRLIEIVERDGIINKCGVVGIRYLFHSLINAGRQDLAYKIITGTTRTCYGYWVKNGDTTLSEAWREADSKFIDSKNHHFLGDISSVFIQHFAGLKPNPNADDISYFEISPAFVDELEFAEASYESKFGTVYVNWERKNDKIELTVKAPKGTKGKIIVSSKEICWDEQNGILEEILI